MVSFTTAVKNGFKKGFDFKGCATRAEFWWWNLFVFLIRLPFVAIFIYQGKGIGTEAIKFVASYFKDWKQFTLITPIDKTENIKFYTEKCGFKIVSTETDGNVKVARFILEKEVYDAN